MQGGAGTIDWTFIPLPARSLAPRLRRPRRKPRVYPRARGFGMTPIKTAAATAYDYFDGCCAGDAGFANLASSTGTFSFTSEI